MMHELWLWDKYAWVEKLFTWKLFAFIFLNWDHVIHIFQNIYVRPFLMIYLSSNYYFRTLLFWNRNPFLETDSSLVLGNFFRENKHDLKRFVVYLEVDNMGKHFFLCQLDLNCRLTEAMIYFALEFLFLTPIQKRFVWFE